MHRNQAQVRDRINCLRAAAAKRNALADRLEAEMVKHEFLLGCAVEQICVRYRVRSVAIFSHSRLQHLVAARQMLAYVLCENGMSTVAIGDVLNRDHTTVIHARNLIARRIAAEAHFAQSTHHLMSDIDAHIRARAQMAAASAASLSAVSSAA